MLLKRFDCLEAGCTFSALAASDDELVSAVQAHVAEAHGSFELEEFILAGAVSVPTNGNDEQPLHA